MKRKNCSGAKKLKIMFYFELENYEHLYYYDYFLYI